MKLYIFFITVMIATSATASMPNQVESKSDERNPATIIEIRQQTPTFRTRCSRARSIINCSKRTLLPSRKQPLDINLARTVGLTGYLSAVSAYVFLLCTSNDTALQGNLVIQIGASLLISHIAQYYNILMG